MSQGGMIIDFDGTAGVLAIGAASVNANIPANTEYLGLSASGNAHFRIGSGTQTAVSTDPLITPNGGIVVIRVPPPLSGQSNNLAVIQDGSSTGNISYFRVKQG